MDIIVHTARLSDGKLTRAIWWAHHPELTGMVIFSIIGLALLFLGVR